MVTLPRKQGEPQLKSLIPELKVKRLTYDLPLGYQCPQEGDYLVSVIKDNKVGTVYQVISFRLIKPNKPRSFSRWGLSVCVCPDMKSKVILSPGGGKVWIAGAKGYTIKWYSRDKKRKR